MLAAAAASWVRMRRSRCLIILICSPILLPLLCATFPLLCIAELCIRFYRRKKEPLLGAEEAGEEEEGFRDSERLLEEGREVGLLQRYLEDQLLLVGSLYECGDELINISTEDNHLNVVEVIVVPFLDGMLGAVVPALSCLGILMSVLGVALLESSGSPASLSVL